MALKPPHETYVRNAAELTELWQNMMGSGGFGMRSLWHVFIELDGRLSPVVLPIDDVPARPDPRLLGNLAGILREVLGDTAASTVAVLLSRPGTSEMTDPDRRWARAVRESYGPQLCPWPVHLATHDRIRVFAPDDLIAA
ncbi:MAG TPA: hypothetical protein VE442_07845 [Jatrophihabitans sp.]|jgi:hypothetical protein|nr:hypothetical protein [Jatrophihabitans sp.]